MSNFLDIYKERGIMIYVYLFSACFLKSKIGLNCNGEAADWNADIIIVHVSVRIPNYSVLNYTFSTDDI